MEQAILGLSAPADPKPVDGPIAVGLAETPAATDVPAEFADRLFHTIENLDGRSASLVLSEILWSSSIEEVCIKTLLPLEQMLTVREAEGRITQAQYRFGMDWILRKLLAAFDASNPDDGRLLIVVAALHDTDALFLSICHALALSRAGYKVHWSGGGASMVDVGQLVEQLAPSALLLFAHSGTSGIAARAMVEHLATARNSGGWRGLVVVCGADMSEHSIALSIEPDTLQIVEIVEAGLRADAGDLRLVGKN